MMPVQIPPRPALAAGLSFYTGRMRDYSPEMLRLQAELAAATAECTAAMNEQFLALMAGDIDTERFNERIAKAQEKRQRAMDSLLNQIRMYGY
jgi:hypothetical protein